MAIKFTQVVDVANQRITSLASPSVGTDAVNKDYVDSVAQGLNWKQAARVAATGNVDIASPGTTIDGVTLATNDRVLLMNQTAQAENGIYRFNGGTSALTRTVDADTASDIANAAVSIAEGTVNGDKTYLLTTNAPITLGTTALVWSLMAGGAPAAVYTAGDGIVFNDSIITVRTAPGGGIVADGTGVALDPSVVVRKFATNVGDGAATTIAVAHNLNTRDVTVELYANGGTYETVYAEVQRTDLNTVTLVFGTAPAAGAYRVVVHG